MKSKLTMKLGVSALAAAMMAGSASAAIKGGDYFDGNWFSPTEDGRGVQIDYIKFGNGSGLLFGALFTYDNDGNATWVTLNVPFEEHQYTGEGTVLAFSGGAFGLPYTDPTSVEVGTVTATMNSCTSVEFSLDMTEASGLPDIDLDLVPTSGIASPQCVYKKEFSACPSFATASSALGRACALSGAYLEQDIVLTNDTTWILNGLVQIGGDNTQSSTITIEPGTVLVGAGGTADYLYINPGSQIFGEGLPYAPIVLTSPNDGFLPDVSAAPGEVGGLVVSGTAPCNSATPPARCSSEFDPTLSYGGEDEDDNSGIVKYWQVRYGGYEFQPNREVNSFTFQAAGRGTVISHIQSYGGLDDAIEFFGGTANARYVVGTAGNDDGLDWDEGWSGKMQHLLMYYTDASNGDHGIEAANNPDNDDALPRAKPIISNATFVGAAGTGDGIRFKEGTAGQIWNSVVTGFAANCIRFKDLTTYVAAGGSIAGLNNDTAFAGVICNEAVYTDQADSPFTISALLDAFPGNEVADPKLDGYMPGAGSPALTGGLQVVDLGTEEADDFFEFVPYRGAFGTIDWTVGWTHDVTGQFAYPDAE